MTESERTQLETARAKLAESKRAGTFKLAAVEKYGEDLKGLFATNHPEESEAEKEEEKEVL